MCPPATDSHDDRVIDTITGPDASPWELLATLAAAALVAARWLPAAARIRTALGATALMTASAAFLVPAGIRWQLLPVLAGAALALPSALSPVLRPLLAPRLAPLLGPLLRPLLERLPGRRGERSARRAPRARRARRWFGPAGSAACAALIATGPAAAWAFPIPDFPRPSGRFAVGTRVLQWTDPARPETFTPDPDDRRTVVVQLWYPARPAPPNAPRARYLGRTAEEARTVRDALADGAGLPGFLLDGATRARTRAVFDAPPADGGGRFPLVLFSPGSSGARTQNTAWAEELASHGYLVAAVDHPYDCAAVVLDDGRTIRSATASSGDRDTDEALAAQWTAIRAADLRFVLDRLESLDHGERPGDPLAGRLDTTRAAVAGHSMGGAAALQAARNDPRFTAALDLDGYPHGPLTPALHQPALALTQAPSAATDPRYLPRLDQALTATTATAYRLTLPGTTHLTFTDSPLYLPPLPSLTGTLDRTEAVPAVTTTTLAFLDAVMTPTPGDPAPALAAHGDLTTHQPPARP
ncbi:alpha/beta hydrolase family protein [Kitasatospora sp. NPDC059646]|uniref:alpha/beta hydrolase family protein n=1 Tax=Kitasatospora sp. NPDC059646 TaxID=3346893 RepID=UPI00369D8767